MDRRLIFSNTCKRKIKKLLWKLFIPNLSASMPGLSETVVCPTFMIHMSDKSLLNLGPSYDSHVKYDLSHSTPIKFFISKIFPFVGL